MELEIRRARLASVRGSLEVERNGMNPLLKTIQLTLFNLARPWSVVRSDEATARGGMGRLFGEARRGWGRRGRKRGGEEGVE